MSLKKLGRYDLIRVLGKGAMGLVYEGRDPNLDRRVAIKTIRVENLSDEAAAEYEVRFRTEARSAARLQHPNIVSVYDSDRDIDIAYLVMEYVQGEDLKHHLDKGDVYTLEQTLSIMGDLLSALSYAHSQGVVHRDIKPANLLVIAGGRIKLADFGVARIQDSGDATRTQGTIVGTLKYMSPEQLEGKPIDARTDLFAAGVVLYQLVTGQRPFDGDTDFAVIQKIVNHKPAAPTSFNAKLPSALDAVVAKALAKSRDARYANAQEFAQALQSACQQASDVTIAPSVSLPAKGSNATWTATMMPGESLVATESGVSTSTGTGTSASLVTQEVELVYWKDVKESSDIEDLQGFLDKFPSGIYGDLARRRLRNLGVAAAVDSSEVTQFVPRRPMTTAEANDKTVLLTNTGPTSPDLTAAPDRHESGPEPTPEPLQESNPDSTLEPKREPTPALSADATQIASKHATPVDAAVVAKPSVPRKKGGMLWIAAAVTVAVVGVAFKLMSGPAQPTDVAAQASGPLLAASAAASSASGALGTAGTVGGVGAAASSAAATTSPTSPLLPASMAKAQAVAAAPSTASSTAPFTATATATVTANVLPASKAPRPASAASAASKAPNPLALKKPAPEKEPSTSTPATASSDPVSATVAPAKAVAAAATSPRAACEDRVLFSFQSCMKEQCAKPVFAQHPLCIERRVMEEERRAVEKNR